MLNDLLKIAQHAGDIIQNVARDELNVSYKTDESPVTQADLLANDFICDALKTLTPNIPIVSEETAHLVDPKKRLTWDKYWLIDPIDGTRGFINDRFYAVLIALIDQQKPVLGVVHVPKKNTCYFAECGKHAYKQHANEKPQRIHTRPCPQKNAIATVSRVHASIEPLVDHMHGAFGNIELLRIDSAYKFCLIAEGKADVYPRLGATCEWDTAAGQVILESAGGRLYTDEGDTLHYNTEASLINTSFIAVGDKTKDWNGFWKESLGKRIKR